MQQKKQKVINLVLILIFSYVILGCGHKTIPIFSDSKEQKR
jgi:hypothetical protein